MRGRSRGVSQSYLGFPFKLGERQIQRCFPVLPGIPLQTQWDRSRVFPVLPGVPLKTQLETGPEMFPSLTWDSPSNSVRDRSRDVSQPYLGFPFKLSETDPGVFPSLTWGSPSNSVRHIQGWFQFYLGFPFKLSETDPEMFPSLSWDSPSNSVRQIQGCFPVLPGVPLQTQLETGPGVLSSPA